MATVKDVEKSYCDEVFIELSGMKDRITKIQDKLKRAYGTQSDLVGTYERHLCELADQIDWKLQILSHACSFDWKGSASPEFAENTVSVGPAENIQVAEFSGGYLGG